MTVEKIETETSKIMQPDVETGETGAKEKHVRTGDKDNEELVIPKNRIIVVFIGLMLSTFLAALDQTIVCNFPLVWVLM
jgi:hypothetical protein